MKKTTIIDVICFLFAMLFVYAAVNKLMDVEKFEVQIGQSPLLTAFASWIAWLIPTGEIVIGVILIIPRSQLLGLYAAFFLMVVFTAYIVAILNFSDYIPCSCGGILEKLNWTEHLIFNSFFVILGLTGILLYPEGSQVNVGRQGTVPS